MIDPSIKFRRICYALGNYDVAYEHFSVSKLFQHEALQAKIFKTARNDGDLKKLLD